MSEPVDLLDDWGSGDEASQGAGTAQELQAVEHELRQARTNAPRELPLPAAAARRRGCVSERALCRVLLQLRLGACTVCFSLSLLQVEAEVERLLARQSELQAARERLQRVLAAEQRAPRADWARGAFEWDGRVQQVLGAVFGLASFRPLQREVINATLQVRACCRTAAVACSP